MLAIGALVGLWLFRRELRRSGLPETALDAAIAGVVGGMAGAKLLWVLEHRGEEQQAPASHAPSLSVACRFASTGR